MAEEIIIFYPPGPINIDIEKAKTMKEIEIILYNKTKHKVLYKINSYDNNIFKINNLLSVIKPLSCTNIKIFLNYKTQINLTNNKYEFKFDFYILNDHFSNPPDLNTLFNKKKGNENQKSIINIFFLNNKLNIVNKEQKFIQDIKKYSKFKNDLIEINNKLKNIIITSNTKNKNKNFFNINKNKFKAFIILLLFIIISGFIFGILLSRQYKKLFKKEKNIKINTNKKEEEEFIEVKFMTVKEADEIKQVNDENIIKFKELNNFNILKEVKRNRELKKFNSENIKKTKKSGKKNKNYGNFLKENIILIYILLIILI